MNSLKDDWRLLSYKGQLNGMEFELIKFNSTVSNDHEHCDFCFAKITDLDIKNEIVFKEGYAYINAKTKKLNFICPECFNDFKEKLDFKIKN